MADKVDDALQTMIANVEKNTGKPLAYWIDVVLGSGHEKHGARVKFLKTEHGFTHGFANMIAHQAKAAAEGTVSKDDLVTTQYAKKQDLVPIYEALIAAVKGFGDGLEISPKKAYVSLRRKKQFALIQPSTKTRLDLGLNLKGKAPEGRLEASGSFNAMCSHRIRLSATEDVDADVLAWLQEAWEAAG